jgi:hypothetical protein
MNPKIFSCILIILDVCTSIVYATKGEGWRSIYWLAAALISTSAIKM